MDCPSRGIGCVCAAFSPVDLMHTFVLPCEPLDAIVSDKTVASGFLDLGIPSAAKCSIAFHSLWADERTLNNKRRTCADVQAPSWIFESNIAGAGMLRAILTITADPAHAFFRASHKVYKTPVSSGLLACKSFKGQRVKFTSVVVQLSQPSAVVPTLTLAQVERKAKADQTAAPAELETKRAADSVGSIATGSDADSRKRKLDVTGDSASGPAGKRARLEADASGLGASSPVRWAAGGRAASPLLRHSGQPFAADGSLAPVGPSWFFGDGRGSSGGFGAGSLDIAGGGGGGGGADFFSALVSRARRSFVDPTWLALHTLKESAAHMRRHLPLELQHGEFWCVLINEQTRHVQQVGRRRVVLACL